MQAGVFHKVPSHVRQVQGRGKRREAGCRLEPSSDLKLLQSPRRAFAKLPQSALLPRPISSPQAAAEELQPLLKQLAFAKQPGAVLFGCYGSYFRKTFPANHGAFLSGSEHLPFSRVVGTEGQRLLEAQDNRAPATVSAPARPTIVPCLYLMYLSLPKEILSLKLSVLLFALWLLAGLSVPGLQALP